MSEMSIRVGIDPAIFTKFPKATVAFTLVDVELFATNKAPKLQQSYLSDLKQRTVQKLIDLRINSENYLSQAVCRSWETVFGMMGAEGKHSTIINLLRRAVGEAEKIKAGSKADLGKISNFVDLYNCVSIQEQTPMGALNLAAIKGDITLRFGREGDTFLGLGKEAVREDVMPGNVVYADNESVVTHLWNYRDAAHACVPKEGHAYVLLFADQAESGAGDAEGAILRAISEMPYIGAACRVMEKLTKDRPFVTLDLSELSEGAVSLK